MAITNNATARSVQCSENRTTWGHYLEVEAPSGSYEFAMYGNTVVVGDPPSSVITAIKNNGYDID